MKKTRKAYSILQLTSAVVMIAALLWLTVSAPFVYASQQLAGQGKIINCSSPFAGSEEEAPLSGTEEKAPNSTNSLSEEYLHDHHTEDYLLSITSQYHKCENAAAYTAFHGEVQVPPPNA